MSIIRRTQVRDPSERYARVSNQKVKQEYLRSMQKILHQSKV